MNANVCCAIELSPSTSTVIYRHSSLKAKIDVVSALWAKFLNFNVCLEKQHGRHQVALIYRCLGTNLGGGLVLHQDLEDPEHWPLEPDKEMALGGMEHPKLTFQQ